MLADMFPSPLLASLVKLQSLAACAVAEDCCSAVVAAAAALQAAARAAMKEYLPSAAGDCWPVHCHLNAWGRPAADMDWLAAVA